jgi:hypothetical protein
MLAVDGLELPIAPGEAQRLRRLVPGFTGRVPLSAMALSDEGAALVQYLQEQGALFDLHVAPRPLLGLSVRCMARLSRYQGRVAAAAPRKWQ